MRLLHRIKNLLRRARRTPDPRTESFGDLARWSRDRVLAVWLLAFAFVLVLSLFVVAWSAAARLGG